MKHLKIVDMFCGGGGESCGLLQAATKQGYKVHLTAINHWERAIETHAANYPQAEHLCEAVEHLDPLKVIPGQKLDLLWASPECTHHSNARGGRPRSEQSRASAWMILKWLSELHVERVIIENVKEFLTWGALGEDGKPIPELKGKTFEAFIHGLRSLGYAVDWRLLRACDYGAPTIRERLFIQAVKSNKKILWPEITHFETENLSEYKPWVPAKNIIDWSLQGESIFNRKRPLAENTLKRIEHGIKKYWGEYAEPFLLELHGMSKTRMLKDPLSSVTTSGATHALIQPFITQYHGGPDGYTRCYSLKKPIPTIDCSPRYGVIEPFITKYYGSGQNIEPIEKPLGTVTTKERFALVEPFITQIGQTSAKDRSRSLSEPLSTICTKNEHCVIEGDSLFDIRFRMLQPHELAAAQGFPSDYIFTGTKSDKVKQIGNAVPPAFAASMYNAILTNIEGIK